MAPRSIHLAKLPGAKRASLFRIPSSPFMKNRMCLAEITSKRPTTPESVKIRPVTPRDVWPAGKVLAPIIVSALAHAPSPPRQGRSRKDMREGRTTSTTRLEIHGPHEDVLERGRTGACCQ